MASAKSESFIRFNARKEHRTTLPDFRALERDHPSGGAEIRRPRWSISHEDLDNVLDEIFSKTSEQATTRRRSERAARRRRSDASGTLESSQIPKPSIDSESEYATRMEVEAQHSKGNERDTSDNTNVNEGDGQRLSHASLARRIAVKQATGDTEMPLGDSPAMGITSDEQDKKRPDSYAVSKYISSLTANGPTDDINRQE
ncbi:hypothetical protein FOL47_006999 [Perkinsus chesapeaki]|uniref:Uncharacterized protein n=1 Tax=Perkinsus chesapeaki TaxID=330153 RepID=A0A7J6MWC5_PERCH|nr:hypothetical protein FOL47_006999 [Perkinsus chesapeaki]